MEEKLVCKKCGRKGADRYPLVAIRTLTVRNGRSSKKYQAMGEVLSVDLCPSCIDAWIRTRSDAGRAYLKALVLPLLLVGVAAVVQFLGLSELIRWGLTLLFGLFGIAVAVSEIKRIRNETLSIRYGIGQYSRSHMIEELAASLLPEKHADAKLSYLLRERVMDEEQHSLLAAEHGVSRRKLDAIREYLLVTPESEVNRFLTEQPPSDLKK